MSASPCDEETASPACGSWTYRGTAEPVINISPRILLVSSILGAAEEVIVRLLLLP